MKQALRARGAISYREIRREFGNGDEQAGKVLLEEIALRLRHARAKHTWAGRNPGHAVTALFGECMELEHAVIFNEGRKNVRYEAVDAAAVSIRAANGEWGQEKC